MSYIIKTNKNKINASIFGGLCLLLITRIVVFPSIFLNFYGKLSQVTFALIILASLYRLKNKKSRIDLKYFIQLVVLYFILFLTTYINSGSLKIVFAQMYPIIGLFLLFTIWNSEECYYSFKSFAVILSVLVILNTTLCVLGISEKIFGRNIFLLGIKNQIAIPIILCNYVLHVVNWRNKRIEIFLKLSVFLCSTITILYIHSGNNILAWAVFSIYFLVRDIPNVEKFTIVHSTIAYAVLFVGVIIFKVQEYFKWLIHDILGKDITFSSRTIIWEKCLNMIKENPWFGLGIQNNNDVIEISGYNINGIYSYNWFSAHNTMLQFLLQSGIMVMFPIMFLIKYTSNKLSMVVSKKLKILSFFMMSSVLVVMFAEAIQIPVVLSVLIIMANLYKIEENNYY